MVPWTWLATCFFTLAAVKLVTVVAQWWLHRRRLYSLVSEPCKGHWFRGHSPANPLIAKEVYISHVRKLPRMFIRQVSMLMTMVSVCHPDTIADAMRKNLPKSELVNLGFRPWLGNGLLISNGKRWARDHRLVSQAFQPSMRREYVGAFKDACNTMLKLWEASPGPGVNVSAFIPALTFDIIMQCAMGAHTSCQTETNPDAPVVRYSAALEVILEIIPRRVQQPWYYPEFIFMNAPVGRRFQTALAETRQFSETLIAERRAILEKTSADPDSSAETNRRRDMLDILLTVRDDDGVGMSDVDVREQVDMFLVAGRDTTSVALQWAVHYLSEHQDVQDQCREEIQDVLGECGGLDNFRHEHIAKLVYLTQTVQEVLRVAPVAPAMSRQATEETVVDGITLPAHTTFQINILGVHYNHQVWSDPDTFNPDRFAPERGPRSAFMPFGYGPRSCIGKHFAMDEVRVVLCMILQKFRLLPDPNATKPVWQMNVISWPCPAVKVLLELVST